MNRQSASGSEIMAAALRDTDRALLVGDTTFGKGSVSILRPLTNGAGLYIGGSYNTSDITINNVTIDNNTGIGIKRIFLFHIFSHCLFVKVENV